MTVTVTVWPDAAANSYTDVATADTYFEVRLGAASWTAATTDQKGQALISATRMIDRQMWQGAVYDAATPQPLQWPRTGVVDKYGTAVATTTLPGDLVLGCMELALALLEDESNQDAYEGGSNVRRVKAGSVEVELFRPTLGLQGRFTTIVTELLGQFMASPWTEASFSSGQLDSDGCDRESYFDEDANTYLYDDWIP